MTRRLQTLQCFTVFDGECPCHHAPTSGKAQLKTRAPSPGKRHVGFFKDSGGSVSSAQYSVLYFVRFCPLSSLVARNSVNYSRYVLLLLLLLPLLLLLLPHPLLLLPLLLLLRLLPPLHHTTSYYYMLLHTTT